MFYALIFNNFTFVAWALIYRQYFSKSGLNLKNIFDNIFIDALYMKWVQK